MPLSRLMERHTAEDEKGDAKKRWDGVRSKVKLQLARQHLEAGRLAEAEKVLTQALAGAPADAEVYLVATRLRLEQGRLAEAREAVNAAYALAGNDPEVAYLSGEVAQRYGDTEQALSHYANAVELSGKSGQPSSPKVADYLAAQAEMLMTLDRTQEALDLLERRLSDFDGDISLRLLATWAARKLDLPGPASKYAQESLLLAKASAPRDKPAGTAWLAYEVGPVLVWAERYEEAIDALEPAISSANSDATGIFTGWGSQDPDGVALSVASNRAEDPHSLLRRSHGRQTPDTGAPPIVAVHALAQAYMGLQRFEAARDVLSPLMRGKFCDDTTATLMARACLSAGQLEAAQAAINKADRESTGAPAAETALLSSYIALKRESFAEALESADRAISLDGQLTEAFCLKGRAAEGLEKWAEAEDAYRAALNLDPSSAAGKLLNALQQKRPRQIAAFDLAGGEQIAAESEKENGKEP